MKSFKILAAALIITAGFTMSASAANPATAGQVMLDFGSLFSYNSYGGDYYDGDMTSSIKINGDSILGAQYFVIDGLSVGASFVYSLYNYDATANGQTESLTVYGVKPMVSFYLPVGENLLINITGFYFFGGDKYSYKGGGELNKEKDSYGLIGGVNFMITEYFCISLAVGYEFETFNNKTASVKSDGNNLLVEAGFKVFL